MSWILAAYPKRPCKDARENLQTRSLKPEPGNVPRARCSAETCAVSALGKIPGNRAHVAAVPRNPALVLKCPWNQVSSCGHFNVRSVAIVKLFERQAKLRSEFIPGLAPSDGLAEHKVRGLPHSGQVVHQRSGPIEDDIPNHRRSLNRFAARAESESAALMNSLHCCEGREAS